MAEGSRESEQDREVREPGAAKSVSEALDAARRHARAALAEALAAARALLDAASLGLSGAPSDAHRGIGTLARSLDQLSASLAADSNGLPPALLDAIALALDAEIARWEARSGDDPDARAVLRAFLGLREILWELGVRGTSADAHAEPAATPGRAGKRAPAAGERRRAKPRVERVRVQG